MKLIVTLLLLSIIIIIASQSLFIVLPSYFYESLILLFLGTAGIYFFLVDIKKQRPEYFVQLYMATLFIKILAYGAYVLFVVWDDRVHASNNALFFMITYFIFTATEIYFLYRKVTT